MVLGRAPRGGTHRKSEPPTITQELSHAVNELSGGIHLVRATIAGRCVAKPSSGAQQTGAN
jgi:hypothetical protein